MKSDFAGTMSLHTTPHADVDETPRPSPQPPPKTGTQTSGLRSLSMGDKTVGLGFSKHVRIGRIAEINKELWLVLSMLIVLGVMNYMVASHRLLLGLYVLPTLFSAYYYGRRHATLTAFVSVFLVGVLAHQNPALFIEQAHSLFVSGRWYDITA